MSKIVKLPSKQKPIPKDGKKLPNYSYYLICPEGRIYSLLSFRYIKSYVNNLGYVKASICDDNLVRKLVSVHRFIATAFVPVPARLQDHPKPEVNHKDGNKANNHYTNLEWCTHQENIQHSYDVLGRKAPTGAEHWNTGKTLAAETKALMSAAKLGENHPKFKGWYLHNGERFASSAALAAVIGISSTEVIRRKNRGEIGFEPFFRQAA